MQPQTIGTLGDVIHHHGRIPRLWLERTQGNEETGNHEENFEQIVQTRPAKPTPRITG